MSELTVVDRVPKPPARPDDSHKGTFGTVIVVGGSSAMIGAPALCARAALRSGSGLVKIATTADILPFALTIEPGATGVLLTGETGETGETGGAGGAGGAGGDGWLQQIDHADPNAKAVLAVGPGMGLAPGGGQKVLSLLRSARSIVLDADGLNLFAHTGRPRPRGGGDLVLTPHPGEFETLAKPLGITDSPTDPATRPHAAARLAQAHHAVVVLKGQHTVVTDGKQIYTNTTGNPALATAGTGDALTGVIASLIGQGLTAFDAATLGVYLHGLAGDHWANRHGHTGLRAQDLADELPVAFEQHRAGV